MAGKITVTEGMASQNKAIVGLIAAVLTCGLGAVAWAVMSNPADHQRARLPAATVSGSAAPTLEPGMVDAPASLAPLAIPKAPPPSRPVRRAPKSRLSPVMQAALADPNAKKHFLVDVATIRDSAPGRAILNCLPQHEAKDLAELTEKSGFDPLTQVHRVGFADRVAVIEGDFAGVDWMQIDPGFEHERRDGVDVYSNGHRLFAVIGDGHMLAGDKDGVEAAIARVQAGETQGAPVPQGDANGTLPLVALLEMLPMQPEVRDPLRAMFAENDTDLNVRVDVSDGGADLQFDLDGLDPMLREGVKAGIEAAKGGGLRPDQQDKFAPLVEGIELDDSDGGLRIRAPVSMEFLTGMLGECAQVE